MIDNYTYTQLVTKLTNSHIMHIIVAMLKLHVYTIQLAGYTAGVSAFYYSGNKKQIFGKGCMPTHFGVVSYYFYIFISAYTFT